MTNQNPPEIVWVNHASFIIKSDTISLISDPWLEGTAVNDAWGLLSKSHFKVEDFKTITHIWFSHEHADHFRPNEMKQIPSEIRKTITILYQNTIDKKVVKFCRTLGFKEVVELPTLEWFELSPKFAVLSAPIPDGDSTLAIKVNECRILNVNDCVVDRQRVRSFKKILGEVDLLLTQYSYASWLGNPEDVELRKKEAAQTLECVKMQISILKPRFVIPFASFVWFCHELNFYLNNEMNRIGDVEKFIASSTDALPIILYPGDRWTLGAMHDNKTAIARYSQDFDDKLKNGPISYSRPVTEKFIADEYSRFLSRLKSRNKLISFLPIPTTLVKLSDLQKIFELSLEGMREVGSDENFDLQTTSDHLLFCLKFDWGANTLGGNGCFLAGPRDYKRFFKFFRLPVLNNHGERANVSWVFKKVLGRAKKYSSQFMDRV